MGLNFYIRMKRVTLWANFGSNFGWDVLGRGVVVNTRTANLAFALGQRETYLHSFHRKLKI